MLLPVFVQVHVHVHVTRRLSIFTTKKSKKCEINTVLGESFFVTAGARAHTLRVPYYIHFQSQIFHKKTLETYTTHLVNIHSV